MNFNLHCEWGEQGLRALAELSDVVIVVDVLSFTTCVDIAISRGGQILPYKLKDDSVEEFSQKHNAEVARRRGKSRFSLSPVTFLDIKPGTKVVLPSPNGAEISLLGPPRATFAGCLRNASSVAKAAAKKGRRITVIPAGEQWSDGSLRPCLEDWLGAGAILEQLPGNTSPEARAAIAAYRIHRRRLEDVLFQCISGRELEELGYENDIRLAAQLNVSDTAPVFDGVAYTSYQQGP